MTMFEKVWKKLARSKSYREEFALAMLKRMVPFQIKAIRKKRDISQTELAQSSNLTQGVISRAEDPDYGNLTLNTIGRVAAGFDLAFIGKFVPFSDLVKLTENLSESEFANLSNFSNEDEKVSASGIYTYAVGVVDVTKKTEAKKADAKKGKNKPSIHRLAEIGRSAESLIGGNGQGAQETEVPGDIENLANILAASGGGQNEIGSSLTR
jgi:transcriptional regulator with XRE-family HTH domain